MDRRGSSGAVHLLPALAGMPTTHTLASLFQGRHAKPRTATLAFGPSSRPGIPRILRARKLWQHSRSWPREPFPQDGQRTDATLALCGARHRPRPELPPSPLPETVPRAHGPIRTVVKPNLTSSVTSLMAGSGSGAKDVALTLQALALKDTCSHCGKRGAALKLCSRCNQASYCGAECQNANWKVHKKTCAPPLSLDEVLVKVNAAHATQDWRGLLKWEWRLEELLEGSSAAECVNIIGAFLYAHHLGMRSTGSKDHALSCVGLGERCTDLLGKMQRFRDQGECLCDLAGKLFFLRRGEEAARHYRRARDVGAAHGFFSVECKACMGLGRQAMHEGRHEEGVELLRNALAAVPLVEEHEQELELDALNALIGALFETDGLDELEPLVLHYREAAKAVSERTGRSELFSTELRSLYYLARLHEARGRPQEAAREVRALLDLMRENQAAVQDIAANCGSVLLLASSHLKILDPGVGEEELINSVAIELAKLPR